MSCSSQPKKVKLMKQVFSCLLLCLTMLIADRANAQANITNSEYFFDADPGFGNGSPITVSTPASNIPALAFSANVSPLTNGVHTLYVRSKDANGKWSITNSMVFAKVQAPLGNTTPAAVINKAEYFFDTDPGFGNGTDIPLGTASLNFSGFVFSANVASLTYGVHILYVRTKDANGKWSMTQSHNFALVQAPYTNPYTAGNLVKMEYFFDADPGIGAATDVPITPAGNLNALVINMPIGSLTSGFHTLYIRSKDVSGKWSITNSTLFSKIQAPIGNSYTRTKIVKAEYFYDNDPGFGYGTDIPVTPALDISGQVFAANVAGLTNGVHCLYVRTKDSLGQWSVSNASMFAKVQSPFGNPFSASNINKAEYFFDTDPGFNNGTDIPLTPSVNLSGVIVNVNVAALNTGIHTLFIRTRNNNGGWSVTNSSVFAKIISPYPNPYSSGNISKMEYFFNNDPGFGNGTDIPITPSTNVSGVIFNANVASLPNGVHTLYTRSKDGAGNWSVTNAFSFAKVQPLYGKPYSRTNINRIEYFVDTDPGLGNASPLSFTPDTNVANTVFNVDMTVLVNGPHKVYVRSRDVLGNWSITNIHEFNGGTAPLSMRLLSFEARLQSGNRVMLNWVTEEEKNVANYLLERSADATNWKSIYTTLPTGNNSAEKNSYQWLDDQPGTGIVYYRLTETDNSGVKTQAPIRFVKLQDRSSGIAKLYPNPNSGKQLTISSDLFADGPVDVSIMGADGKIWLQTTSELLNGTEFLLTDLHLAQGNYFVNLKGKNGAESLKLQVTGTSF